MAIRRDEKAGQLLAELRESRGLSPEDMPRAMLLAGIERREIPSARTIRRVEEVGSIPQARYKCGLAKFHERGIVAIWDPRKMKVVA